MNYREIKKSNEFKTKIVLTFYLAMFLFIGLLGEVVFLTLSYNTSLIEALEYTVKAILTGELIPWVIITMSSISLLIVFITIKFGNKILLSGNEYIKLNDKENLSSEEQQILNIVEELKISSRVRFMPEVYIIEADYMNAFASGWNESNSMVAITRGLLDKLTRAEVAAVLAHEMAHVKNADVKLTLVTGILTNIMVYAVDFLFYFFRTSNSKAAQQAKLVLFILKIFLPILTIVLQLYISRKREFMADAGSVEFTGDKDSMISALKKISGDYEDNKEDYEEHSHNNNTRQYAYFFGMNSGFFSNLFSTHPTIENRISSLEGSKR
ncbi:zinc metalloprotease HtpX [bacterium]|jgi:heat shock protein HtpX|nr:zinc metalloprotease HtpX [bacterium]